MKFLTSPYEIISVWNLYGFLALGLVCAITDLLKDKIYNIITLPLILFGMLICTFQSPSMWWISVLSVVFVFSIYLPLVVLKIMGAGDAKLSMAFASILGIKATWELFFLSIVIASFGTIAIMIRKKRLGHFLKEIKLMFQSIFYKGLLFHWPQLDKNTKSPFGLAIFLSFALIVGERVYVL